MNIPSFFASSNQKKKRVFGKSFEQAWTDVFEFFFKEIPFDEPINWMRLRESDSVELRAILYIYSMETFVPIAINKACRL